ncbi:TetR/AcrR family transcriptional regulator [Zavarzinia compransoris]|uniref:TetR/AcrR family transcriptional regulator n=1 Tax=Zavarzinia marina TaxID=2911065 RepID=UPI001F1BB3CF|nr:TetR/AcrR family transcriptional regulator [Zavarzinia marina]MCF4166249.1 TetR/AcrR family transcriptional regulator [Zavarzinia marina]
MDGATDSRDKVARPRRGARKPKTPAAERDAAGARKSASGREAIMACALQLFGDRGFEGVSTAEILEAAGQRNQTALQYHFGSREGLYKALLESYLRPIDERRLAILSATARPSFVTCLRALIEPLIDEVGDGPEGLAYLRFLRQFTSRPGFDILEVSRTLDYPGMKRLIVEAERHLGDVAPARRGFAIGVMLQITVTLLSAWRGEGVEAFDREGFIAAAVAACRALHRSLAATAPP